MNLINWLTTSIAEALGWTLIHALWQGFAVVLTVALLLHLTRRSRAALRYQLGMSGLLAQILASVITFGWYYEPRSLAPSGAMNQAGFRASLLQMAPANESWLATTQGFLNAHLAEVVWIWLVGIGVFGVRLIGGWAYVQRLKTTATLPVPSMLTEVMAQITPKLAVSARLQLSARATGPMVVGVLKPVVLWPVGLLAGLSMADVEAILAHELAHVRRHDYLLNVLQSVVEVLYFFHPALWWLSARVREEREHCCDDVAVEIIGDARVLARALARVEEWQRKLEETPDLAMAFASKRQLLLQRVRRMLGVPTRPLISDGSLAGLTLVTMLLLSVSVYAVQRTQEEPKPARQLAPTQTNRRHRVNRNSEYGMTNNQMSEGMAHIDYSNIMVDAKDSTPDLSDVGLVGSFTLDAAATEKLLSIQTPDAYRSVREYFLHSASDTSKLSAVQRQLEILTKQMQEIMTERQPIADKLSKEMAELTLKNEGYQKKAGQFAKQQVALARQQSVMAKQQAELARKLNPLNREIERLARLKTAQASQLMKQKELQSQLLEKQMNELGDKMGKMGSQMGDIGNQMQSQMEPYQQRMGVLADSINKLYEPTYAISEKIGELSEKIAEEAGRQADEAAKQAEEAVRQVEAAFEKMDAEGVYRDRPARAVRPSRSVRPARPPHPAMAPRPPRPSVDATPAIAPTPPPAPARAPRPAPTPRVAPVPAPAAAPKPPK